ncbi:porin (plasmid) [Aliisedimentitalea scapharcae]|uniref:Porin n=1 Tax=Aliisedimentitalea scapharcae TaxID=1524259 RepID=A0ABZ2XZF6_9RHOB
MDKRILGMVGVGLVSFAHSFAMPANAQQTDASEAENALESSQNWSRNWEESWRDSLAKRQSFWQKLLQWQISDHTLVRIYGQFNLGQLNYDDGFNEINTLRDNPNAPSRIGVRLDTDFNNGGNLFLNIESAFARSTYDGIFRGGVGSGNSDAWNKTLLRKLEARVYNPQLGHFSFGQGSMAGDGITGFDFSGTTVVSYSSVGDTISGIPARQLDGTESTLDLQTFFPVFDASRRFRFRYDSLAHSNASISFAIGKEVLIENDDNTYADIALRYETSWRGFGVKAGIAYAYNDSSPAFLSGSVAGLDEESGLNFAVAAGANDIDGRFLYGKLGVIRQLSQLGTTAFSVDYYTGWNPHQAATNSRSWGVSVVQRIDPRNLELYATYRRYSVDGTAVAYQDADAILVGARISW